MKISKIQVIANALAIIPGLILAIQIIFGTLSANPIQTATVITGRASIYLLLITLYCSPLQRMSKMSMFLHIRKTTGLYSFYYALAHFLIFTAVDYQLNLDWLLPEFRQKPFLRIGLIALLILCALAVTSIQSIKKLMGNWWKRLHFLVYGAAGIIIVHIALALKGDLIDPILLAAVFLLAMALRVPPFSKISIKSLPDWARRVNSIFIH
jgi:sulfoxide reductase heme-binding subunit YedZ